MSQVESYNESINYMELMYGPGWQFIYEGAREEAQHIANLEREFEFVKYKYCEFPSFICR